MVSKVPKRVGRLTTNEDVNSALDKPSLTFSRAILRCRLEEIAKKQREEAEDFDAWARKTFFVP